MGIHLAHNIRIRLAQAFFNILKEPLLVEKQTIPQKKVRYSAVHLPQKNIEKKRVNLIKLSQDAKKKSFDRANLILIL